MIESDQGFLAGVNKLEHVPLRPVRQGVFEEQVFLEHWQRLMAEIPDGYEDAEFPSFEQVFANLWGPPTPRDAQVAATFAVWLGTNCGSGWVREAQSLAKRIRSETSPGNGGDAWIYQATWQRQDTRALHVNGGRRYSEHLCGSEVSYRDLEVMDRMAWWLGTPQGKRWFDLADAECSTIRKHLGNLRSMHNRAELRALALFEEERKQAKWSNIAKDSPSDPRASRH